MHFIGVGRSVFSTTAEVGPVSEPTSNDHPNNSGWSHNIIGHPDRYFVEYVEKGIRKGFRIGFQYHHQTRRAAKRNLVSALTNLEVVEEYNITKKELQLGRVAGPLSLEVSRIVHASPFGVISARRVTSSSGGPPRLDFTTLEETVHKLYQAGSAPSTSRSYSSGKKRYLSFCDRAAYLLQRRDCATL